MNKTCTLCGNPLPRSEFNKKNASKDGLQNVCRQCNREKSRMYYEQNKEKHQKAINKNRSRYVARNTKLVNEIKIECGCCLCDESEFCCLDFHHVRDKERPISKLVKGGWAWKSILEEMRKCIIVCSNCHRKIHAGILSVKDQPKLQKILKN